MDIKPYIPDFDSIEEVRIGWLKNSAQNVKNQRSDQRFQVKAVLCAGYRGENKKPEANLSFNLWFLFVYNFFMG